MSLKLVPKGPIDNIPTFGLDNGLAHIWTNAKLIHWRIYAALGGDELSDDARSQGGSQPPMRTFTLYLFEANTISDVLSLVQLSCWKFNLANSKFGIVILCD